MRHDRATHHVALVTGANHGIGAAIAVALAADGCDVLATYLRFAADPEARAAYNEKRALGSDALVATTADLAGRVVAIEADLTDAEVVGELFDEAERQLGPVGILVNNASGWQADSFADPVTVTAASIDRNFAVDAKAGALLIAEFVRRHVARGASWGRIVGLTSGSSLGFPGEVSYGAAKAALENYAMSAAVELARHGITVNALHPPVTDTGWVTDDVRRFVADSPDHVHVAEPPDVAEVVTWLCSDAAGLVTGNVIRLR